MPTQRSNFRRVLLAASVATVVAVSALFLQHAVATEYTFTQIAREYDYYDGAFSYYGLFSTSGTPVVDNNGQVYFADSRNRSGSLIVGIFRGDGSPATPILDNSGELKSFKNVAVSGDGQVAFYGATAGTAVKGIYRLDGETATLIADNSSFKYVSTPAINNAGQVAFRGSDAATPTVIGIYRGDGASLTTIADNTTFTDMSAPSINDRGTVAFQATTPGVWGIYTGSGGGVRTLYDTGSGQFYNCSQPDINNDGTVAFLASAGSMLLKGNGGPLTTVADTTGPYRGLGFATPSINNVGNVLFSADMDSYTYGGAGIFTGPDYATDKIVQQPATLFGYTLSGIALGSGWNDRGQAAFIATLNTPYKPNGEQFIVLATPVPEPATLAMLGVVVAGWFLLHRARWRR